MFQISSRHWMTAGEIISKDASSNRRFMCYAAVVTFNYSFYWNWTKNVNGHMYKQTERQTSGPVVLRYLSEKMKLWDGSVHNDQN